MEGFGAEDLKLLYMQSLEKISNGTQSKLALNDF